MNPHRTNIRKPIRIRNYGPTHTRQQPHHNQHRNHTSPAPHKNTTTTSTRHHEPT